MKFWQKKTTQEIQERVRLALSQNRSYYDEPIIGVPCSYLDSKIFPVDSPILDNAPYLQTLVNNPNHIGCHTIAESESIFDGTQQLERELLDILACGIFKAEAGAYDGYVASGGTEANIQALWIYREYFRENHGFAANEVAVVCSADTHYSIPKGCNILNLPLRKIAVDNETRQMAAAEIQQALSELQNTGTKAVIFVANMMTTMFGSVDEVEPITAALIASNLLFKLHIDGAYGGFFYPFSDEKSQLHFQNPHVSSITVDAHKMAQAPFGTGIFLARKGLIGYTHSKDASYVKGEDYTLIGSRSGANAVAVWMILSAHGPYGWAEKTLILLNRTDWFCRQLTEAGIAFYRHPKSNIVTIKAEFVKPEVAEKYYIVPDDHHHPQWYKVIVMEHVYVERLESFLEDISRHEAIAE